MPASAGGFWRVPGVRSPSILAPPIPRMGICPPDPEDGRRRVWAHGPTPGTDRSWPMLVQQGFGVVGCRNEGSGRYNPEESAGGAGAIPHRFPGRRFYGLAVRTAAALGSIAGRRRRDGRVNLRVRRASAGQERGRPSLLAGRTPSSHRPTVCRRPKGLISASRSGRWLSSPRPPVAESCGCRADGREL
jgi:hypothetical protein